MFNLMKDKHEDTGMSIASLVPMGKLLRVGGLMSYGGTGVLPKFYDSDYWPTGGFTGSKSFSSGERIGRQQLASGEHAITYGSQKRVVLKFRVTIGVLQWALHEANISSPLWGKTPKYGRKSRAKSGGWQQPFESIDTGKEAFRKQLTIEMRKLRKLIPAFVIEEIMGGSISEGRPTDAK
jgi:hypothetical protein